MRHVLLSLVALGLFCIGCSGPDATAPTADRLVTPQFAAGGVLHRVAVGSHDFTPPGVDANFSLTALEKADGSETGQWSDQYGHGNGGIHVAVTCVSVVANRAWISGLTTDPDFEGHPVITEVEDNGTSANDPPDRISFSVIDPAQFGLSANCHLHQPLPLFPLQGGEVKVD